MTTCQTCLVLVACLLAPIQPVAAKPDILFVAIDDLNDWIGPLGGHPQANTPNIDRLAERGMTFANAHVTALPVLTGVCHRCSANGASGVGAAGCLRRVVENRDLPVRKRSRAVDTSTMYHINIRI